MTPTRKPTAPAGLGPAGRTFWRDVLKTYDLRADELRVLDHACRSLDLCGRLAREVSGLRHLTTIGSKGQVVAHPLIAEARSERLAFARLCRQLGLPDDFAEAAMGASAGGRSLALARWGRSR